MANAKLLADNNQSFICFVMLYRIFIIFARLVLRVAIFKASKMWFVKKWIIMLICFNVN